MQQETPVPPPERPGVSPEPPRPTPEAPAAAMAPAAAPVPQLRPGSGPPSAAYPAVTEFDHQEEYRRFLPLVKWLLLIPHMIVLWFVLFGAFLAIGGAWWAVLFTGKYPPAIHRFVTGAFRWSARVMAYGMLMTDRYPPFTDADDPEHPVRFEIAYQERVANWRPLVQWLLAIPHLIVLYALVIVAYIITVIAFFSILFTKKFPDGLFNFNVVAFRWQNRVNAYMYFMTDRYPPWEWA